MTLQSLARAAAFRLVPCLLTVVIAFPAAAQDATVPAATGTETEVPAVRVGLDIFVIRPKLDENGLPVLDEQGKPVLEERPAETEKVLPGDRLSYHVRLTNDGAAAQDVELNLPLGAGLDLHPETLHSDFPLSFVASSVDDDGYFSVFVTPGGKTTTEYQKGAARGLDGLKAVLADLPRDADGEIVYGVTVR